jgi:diguanylate cyclase (GGDEF)-like protein
MKATTAKTSWKPQGQRLPKWQPGVWLRSLRNQMSGYEQPILGDALVIDRYLIAERLRSGERLAELFRWTFILLFLVLNTLQPTQGKTVEVAIDSFLGLWAAINLYVTYILFRGYRPNRWFCYGMTVVDVALASALIGLSGGLASPFYIAFFLAIISGSIRFGMLASIFTSLMIALLYIWIGGYTTMLLGGGATGEVVVGRVFTFLVVGIITGLMSQELIRERQVAIGRAAEKDALQDMHNEMTSTINLNEVLGVVLRQAVHIVGGKTGRILTVSADGSEMKARGVEGEQVLVFEEFDFAEARKRPLLIENRHRMLVPILAPHSEDAILIDLTSKHGFSRRQFDMVTQLGRNATGPVNNSLRYLSKETEAITDPLTGLVKLNEMLRFMGVLIKRYKSGQEEPFSVMMIDIDNFKQINDDPSYGHEYGNEVLARAAQLIGKTMRSHDMVVRYGGDEMAAIMVGAGLAEADQAAGRLVAAVRAAKIPSADGGIVTFSVGVATYPDHSDTAQGLIEAADQGLYLVKRAGKNGANRLPTRAERAYTPVETSGIAEKTESDEINRLPAKAERTPAPIEMPRVAKTTDPDEINGLTEWTNKGA